MYLGLLPRKWPKTGPDGRQWYRIYVTQGNKKTKEIVKKVKWFEKKNRVDQRLIRVTKWHEAISPKCFWFCLGSPFSFSRGLRFLYYYLYRRWQSTWFSVSKERPLAILSNLSVAFSTELTLLCVFNISNLYYRCYGCSLCRKSQFTLKSSEMTNTFGESLLYRHLSVFLFHCWVSC